MELYIHIYVCMELYIYIYLLRHPKLACGFTKFWGLFSLESWRKQKLIPHLDFKKMGGG